MSDYGSAKTYRSSRTYIPSSSAVNLWWNIGKRRSNSDTASIISRHPPNRGKKINRLSVPTDILHRTPSQLSPPSFTQSESYDNLDDLSKVTHRIGYRSKYTLVESAVSDTSLEDIRESQAQDFSAMGDRGIRQNDRTSIIDTSSEDRRERTRTGRNLDTSTTSSRTLTPAPSLFEACRELRRHGVKVSLPSSMSFGTTNINNANLNNQGRQGGTMVDRERVTIPSYPEQLLSLPAEPSLQDLCLKTALNAGAAVEFIPRSSSTSLSSGETFTCEHCHKKFTNEQDWDAHESKQKTFCPFCELTFDCHGLLLRHRDSCSGRA